MTDEQEVKRKVLKRFSVRGATISKDKLLKAAFDSWTEERNAFYASLQRVKNAKNEMKGLLRPKLKQKVTDSDVWDVREGKASGSVIIEVVKTTGKKRGPAIEAEDLDF